MAAWQDEAARLVGDLLERLADLGAAGEPEDAARGVVTGFVLIAETATPDGRWLHRVQGPEALTTWAREGLLHNGLYGDWPEED